MQFSDWLRLALLEAHGGVWFDSTVLLTAPLSLLVNETARLSGVHLEAALFEAFFIAAKEQHDSLIKGWRDAFWRLSQLDEEKYDAELVALRSAGVEPLNGAMAHCAWRTRSPLHRVAHRALHFFARAVNGFISFSGFYLHPCGERYWMHYLKTYVAFNSVIKTKGESVLELYPSLNIHVSDSFETLSSLAVSLDWNSSDIVDFLSTARSADVDLEAHLNNIYIYNNLRKIDNYDYIIYTLVCMYASLCFGGAARCEVPQGGPAEPGGRAGRGAHEPRGKAPAARGRQALPGGLEARAAGDASGAVKKEQSH